MTSSNYCLPTKPLYHSGWITEVCENTVLGRTFGNKEDKWGRKWRHLHNVAILRLCSPTKILKANVTMN
jgi:hypothetical protein